MNKKQYSLYEQQFRDILLEEGHQLIGIHMTFEQWLYMVDGLILLSNHSRITEDERAKAEVEQMISHLLTIFATANVNFALLSQKLKLENTLTTE